jgi:hypothetical protein
MLLVGRQRCRTCRGLTRRAFLEVGASSVFGVSLADLLRARATAGSTAATGTARSVLLLWLWGGPSHLDTWDPKPAAPLEYRGPFTPVATSVAGVRVTELFPRVARLARHFALVRGLHTDANDHGVAGTIGLTGSSAGGVGLDGRPLPGTPRPATGSVVARARGVGDRLPPFMVIGGRLHQGKKAIIGEDAGALGALYDPFRLEYDPERGTRIPALQLAPGLTPERLRDRRRLLRAVDEAARQAERLQRSRALGEHQGRALDLLTDATTARAFDLSAEPDRARDAYGRTRFGQSCLLARRLVEHGVPFVQVNWSDHVEPEEDAGDGGWDHHYRNFQIMQDRHAPWLDQTLSTLLDDLRQRGLLGRTLVLVVGEFGRTPRINPMAGRDHWEHCYSALLAGGGVQGGRVVGSSDARGEHPHDGAATPADLAATIFHAAGITTEVTAALGLPAVGQVIAGLL